MPSPLEPLAPVVVVGFAGAPADVVRWGICAADRGPSEHLCPTSAKTKGIQDNRATERELRRNIEGEDTTNIAGALAASELAVPSEGN